MGGHGHGPPYVVPDHSIYKVEGIAQLDKLQKALAKKGLKDPWIRNEVWRYHPGFGTKWGRAKKALLRGAPQGLALAIITVAATKAYEAMAPVEKPPPC